MRYMWQYYVSLADLFIHIHKNWEKTMIPLFGLRECLYIESLGALVWEQVLKPIVGSTLRLVMTIFAAIFFSVVFLIFGIGIFLFLLAVFCFVVYAVGARGIYLLSEFYGRKRRYGKCFKRGVKVHAPLRMEPFLRRS